MGNTSSTSSLNSNTVPEVAYFCGLSLSTAVDLLTQYKKASDNSLSWRLFYRTLETLSFDAKLNNEAILEKFAHPATMSYVLIRDKSLTTAKNEVVGLTAQVSKKSDYFTDDSASESSELYDEDDNSSKLQQPIQNNNTSSGPYDANVLSPIFFGFKTENRKQFLEKKANVKKKVDERCRRAIENARKVRSDAVTLMEQRMEVQRVQREKKMATITEKFNKEVDGLRKEFDKDSMGATEDLKQLMTDELDQKVLMLEAAFQSEIHQLRTYHDNKNKSDNDQLLIRRGELRALIELQDPAAPLADQLERFARIELGRLSTALSEALTNVDKVKEEFLEIKNETISDLEEQQQQGKDNPALQKKNRELRSMLNVAETKLKEAIRNAKNIEEELLDAEALMQKSLRVKAMEKAFLPFFQCFLLPISTKEAFYADRKKLCLGLLAVSKGSFVEKIAAILRTYDVNANKDWDIETIKGIFLDVIEVFRLLGVLSGTEDRSALDSAMLRYFKEMTLKRREDTITMYELQTVIMFLIIKQPSLSHWFNLKSLSPRLASFSTFQIHTMKEIAFLSFDTSTAATVSHSSFLQSIRFRSHLDPMQRRKIHDISLSMGTNDPFKVDFGRFLAKGPRKSSYRVAPLDNGRDTSLWSYEQSQRSNAIVKIQSTVRSFVARRKFERAAMEEAYAEARQSALQLAKAKILKEFQQREAGKGIGKMKWDAEVRIQQAKYRANGRNLSRSDTVMLMVEMAIVEAQQIVERRFEEILPTVLVKVLNPVSKSAKRSSKRRFQPTEDAEEDDFGFNPRGLQSAATALDANADIASGASVDADDNASLLSVDSSAVAVVESDVPAVEKYTWVLQHTRCIEDMWFHVSTVAMGRGESELHRTLRIFFASPEYTSSSHLAHILRLLSPALTEFKVSELLNEFPSKRLLANYLLRNEIVTLQGDLREHFKFHARAEGVLLALREYFRQCDEGGRLGRFSKTLEAEVDEGMSLNMRGLLTADIKALEDNAVQKAYAQKKSTEDILVQEYSSALTSLHKLEAEFAEVAAASMRSLQRTNAFEYALQSQWTKLAVLRQHGAAPYDDISRSVFGLPPLPRQDWWTRYLAIERLSNSPTHKHLFTLELQKLFDEFITLANQLARVVIEEWYVPAGRQSIPIVRTRALDGRPSGITGRGFAQGVKRLYRSHSMYLAVSQDGDGVCNGSDELAAKIAGKERMGARLLLECGVTKIAAPLCVTVDYFGFRVLVTCEMPLDKVHFNDEGVLQSVSQDLVHGLSKDASFFTNQSRVAQSYLKIIAQRLNLAEHQAKGLQDLSSSGTFAAGLKVFKGDNNDTNSSGSSSGFYVLHNHCWFPRELPEHTPHLLNAPRRNSIFWRFLRPECFRSVEQPLSADCGLISTFQVQESVDFRAQSKQTTEQLLNETIPKFLRRLLALESNYFAVESKQFSLAHEMHKVGINLRHLGHMRSFLWRKLPGKFNLFHNEKIIRSTLFVDHEVFGGDFLQVGAHTFVLDDLSMTKSRKHLPIKSVYDGDSMFNASASCGRLLEARGREDVEHLLLAEMVSRTIKHLVRHLWRLYFHRNQSVSRAYQARVLCYHLNMLTSSEVGASVYASEVLYNAVRLRFGKTSLFPSERTTLLERLRPNLRAIVVKVCHLLGVTLTPLVLSSFLNHPEGHCFALQDVASIESVVKTSFPQHGLLKAANITRTGDALWSQSYTQCVLDDAPTVFYRCSERKGALWAENAGSLGSELAAKIADGCLLYESGPIVGEKFTRSIGFSPVASTVIDAPYHKDVVPVDVQQPFGVEVFFNVLGGRDVQRTILDSGRYQIGINRENKLQVVVYASLHAVSYAFEVAVREDDWHHVVLSFDGVNLIVYFDACVVAEVDLVAAVAHKQRLFDAAHRQQLQVLKDEENEERAGLMAVTTSEATSFFATKEGQAVVKALARQILDTEANEHNLEEGNDDMDHARLVKERKANAMKSAKDQYIQETYEKSLRALNERFKSLSLDLEDRRRRAIDQGQLHSFQHLRLGASLPDANNRLGSGYFLGRISCVSVYTSALSADRWRRHYLAAKRDCRRDAFRIYSEAVSAFAVAWKGFVGDMDAPHVTEYLATYAHAICQLFAAQYEEKIVPDRLAAKAALLHLIDIFHCNSMPGAIAEILRHLPRESDFAEVVIAALLSLKEIDKNYLFAQGLVQDYRIVMIPFDFALIVPAPRHYRALEAAAYLLQQVARDRQQAFAYSDAVDLHWLLELYSPALVVSIVLAAHSDGAFKILRIANAELIEQWQVQLNNPPPSNQEPSRGLQLSQHVSKKKAQEVVLLSDADVQTIAEHLPLLQGVDFSHCGRGITDAAWRQLSRFSHLKLLVLDDCGEALTDASVSHLAPLASQLEVLSLQNAHRLSDAGLLAAFATCQHLLALNLSGCVHIGVQSIARILEGNAFLTSLGLARLLLTDRCLTNIVAALDTSNALLTNVDLSFCADVTDSGLLAFAESAAVAKLRSLNLQGVMRVSWRSVAVLSHRCWGLETVSLDDVYLLRDAAFAFDNRVDGRSLTQAEMLSHLQSLSVATCHDLTDLSLRYLGEHCRHLHSLVLRDCGQFTDTGLRYLCDTQLCAYSKVSLAASLTSLNLAYAGRFTPLGVLHLLETASKLVSLDVSGLATLVDDDLVARMARACPGLQQVGLGHCLQITDVALCSLAEALWVEEIRLSHCVRISDRGLEVLAEACTGLRVVEVQGAKLISERAVRFVQSNCASLERIVWDGNVT